MISDYEEGSGKTSFACACNFLSAPQIALFTIELLSSVGWWRGSYSLNFQIDFWAFLRQIGA